MDLCKYIKYNNISLRELSKKADIPYTTLFDLYSGKRNIKLSNAFTVYKLSKVMGINMEDLIMDNTKFDNKYTLSQKESLFLLKKRWDKSIYTGMKMENRPITFPETKAILEGVNIPNISLSDITAILNMRDAYKFIENHLYEKLDLEYILKINSYVSRNESLEWGVLRTGNVGIGGTDYIPEIPKKEKVEGEINRILCMPVPDTEIALELFAYLTRTQLFWDGNKRTALVVCNKFLISTGHGFIDIADKNILEFNKRLLNYYNTNDSTNLLDFLYKDCIIGID